jgi:hypothetical protein
MELPLEQCPPGCSPDVPSGESSGVPSMVSAGEENLPIYLFPENFIQAITAKREK